MWIRRLPLQQAREANSALGAKPLAGGSIADLTNSPMAKETNIHRYAAGWVCGGLFIATLVLMSPGLVGNDEADMLRQAETGIYNDWHSALLAWVWHWGLLLRPGPLAIHTLEVGIYFLGIHLLASSALAHGHRWAGWAIISASVFPLNWIALAAAGSKDVILTGLMLLCVSALARFGESRSSRAMTVLWVILLSTLAMNVRHNAIFAAFPILAGLVWLLARNLSPLRRLLSALIVGAVLALMLMLASGSVIKSALKVQASNVTAGLFLFDLAGISAKGRLDASQGFLGEHFAATVEKCYDPLAWDPLAIWGKCPEAWAGLFGQRLMEDQGDSERKHALQERWLAAILAHPLAYANHRLAHFTGAVGLSSEPVGQMSWVNIEAGNPSRDGWVFAPILVSLDRAATRQAASPLMAPYIWFLLAVAGLLALRFVPPSMSALTAAAFFSSGLAYGLGYLLIGVASALRYFHWTIAADLMGLVFLAMAIKDSPNLQIRADRR